jgi:hypothetical protein
MTERVVPTEHENVCLGPTAGSGADPSGPIWLLKEAQPNLRTFRDGTLLGSDMFSVTWITPPKGRR